MQDEINQRLTSTVSRNKPTSGVKVLVDSAPDAASWRQRRRTITLNLSEISVKTLGLTASTSTAWRTQNRSATAGSASCWRSSVGNDWTVTTTHAATADQTSAAGNGNTVTAGAGTDATVYTYDAANKNFTFTDKSASDAGAEADQLTLLLAGKTGTTSAIAFPTLARATSLVQVDVRQGYRWRSRRFLDASAT